MAMAPTVKVKLGSAAFAVFYILAVFSAVPFLPIGRTAGSLLGALLMWKSKGAKDLIFRICLISAISSAFFTNDTSCVVLTEFVLKIARQHNLPPHPFLLALASSTNIGSSATPIGNPQNLVIAVQSKISFGKFLVGIPAMVVGVFVNALIIIGMFWKVLSTQKDEEDASPEVVAEDEYISHRFSPATMSHLSPSNSIIMENGCNYPSDRVHSDRMESLRNRLNLSDNEIHSFDSSRKTDESIQQKQEEWTPERAESVTGEFITQLKLFLTRNGVGEKWKPVLWKISVYLVTIGMLIALLFGLDMSWTAITAALALVVLDFKDARPSLEKVSYSLLIFLMFVTVDGFNKTGIPGQVWDIMEPYSEVDSIGGKAVLALVILVLSNLDPTVLLLGGQVAASAAAISATEETKAWLILAWVSTVAGNLSLLGSAANLIVREQARQAPYLGVQPYVLEAP